MISVRKRKKELKKLYSKAIACGLIKKDNDYISLRSSSRINCTPTYVFDYYVDKKGNVSDKPMHLYEITQFSYCPYNNEYDSWDCSNYLKSKTKDFKSKYKILKFKFFKIEI